jgi:hypothetical protein
MQWIYAQNSDTSYATVVVSRKIEQNAASQIVYQDDLTTDNNTWTTAATNIDVRRFSDGHYSIRNKRSDHIVYSLAPYSTINFPYTVQVEGTTILDDPSQRGNVSVVFNYTDNVDFNVAEIWTNGTFRIWTRANGITSTTVGFTVNSAIHTGSGSTNTIRLVQDQTTTQLYVNNILLGTFNIPMPAKLIQTGPAVATAKNNYTPETGLFNNFSISKN